mgnify:CR=1 FL=1
MAGAIALAGYFGYNPPDFAAGTVAAMFATLGIHAVKAAAGGSAVTSARIVGTASSHRPTSS